MGPLKPMCPGRSRTLWPLLSKRTCLPVSGEVNEMDILFLQRQAGGTGEGLFPVSGAGNGGLPFPMGRKADLREAAS